MPRLDLRELLMLAIATSIDALAVGVSFAFLDVAIAPSAAFIGVTTFVLSFAGVAIGHQFGSRWEKPSTIVGGTVLILIGVKILLEIWACCSTRRTVGNAEQLGTVPNCPLGLSAGGAQVGEEARAAVWTLGVADLASKQYPLVVHGFPQLLRDKR